jgi:hypothetical protein
MTPDITHDIEEDHDPYYSQHGVSGSTADTCRYDADEVEEVCRICGLTAMRVEVR